MGRLRRTYPNLDSTLPRKDNTMKTISLQITILLFVVLITACAAPPTLTIAPTLQPATASPAPVVITPTTVPSGIDEPPASYALKDVSMTLERTVCFGTCPSYIVTVQGNGMVNYDGRDFVKVKGAQTRTISQEAVFELLKVYYESDFFGFRDEYFQGRTVMLEADGTVKESGMIVTDLPTTIVTIHIGSYVKSVRAYFQAPDAVYTIATKIDEAAGTAAWVKPQ